ncbi:uncharacterized protein RSE6_02826 [Rhynchosporium secalis]|uniref:AAA+ ATPase domain-containing protein n=1 Tax=Rhynchosporium secalis TaxID=38038 RepID=A0A1E1M189_RHYSE|nr:uncharacterized protein RSE6_02826 [Rhynchosporium secalis]
MSFEPSSPLSSLPMVVDFANTPSPKSNPKRGTLFIEARLKDSSFESGRIVPASCEKYAERFEAQLVKNDNTFDMLEDILADKDSAICKLGPVYDEAKAMLHSLKVVEYVGPKTLEACFSSCSVEVKVNLFQLYIDTGYVDKENEDGQLGELICMPHARFEGVWDELVFDHEVKADLIWMMTNILRFSRAFAAHKVRRKLNPLILLYGPPGSGKTSLCLGLAQKISTRLSGTYKATKLVQIKTAVLLSKWFSESAKHIDDIFNRISAMCEGDPEGFVCVLIDEVESIACSREYSTKEGESHDSLRATNALLTGLDRTATFPNVVFLFTSNMCEALEPAFLDRCGLKEFVGPPRAAAQYEILRSSLQKLISCEVIQSAVELPSYDGATVQANLADDLPGPKLLDIIKLMHSSTADRKATQMSGRSLGQLPERALMRYLRKEDCDMDAALGFLRKCAMEVGNTAGVVAKLAPAKIVEAEMKNKDWIVAIEKSEEISTSDGVTEEDRSIEEEVYKDGSTHPESLNDHETGLFLEEEFEMVVVKAPTSNPVPPRPEQRKRLVAQSREDFFESATVFSKEYDEGTYRGSHKRTKI